MCDVLVKELKEHQTLYISGGLDNKAMKVSTSGALEEPLLTSNIEEADGRIIFHASFAAQLGVQKLVVRSPDTDVLVLLLYHRPGINAKQIYFFTGKEE